MGADAYRIRLNPRGGLGIHIAKAIEAKYILGEVCCDWRGTHMFYDIPAGENYYDWAFEPQPPMSPAYKEADKIRHRITSPSAGWAYLHPTWSAYRRELSKVWWRDFHVRPEVLAKVTAVRGMVGAIYRTEINVEADQLMKGIPPREQFAAAVEEEAGEKDIWICAHAQESVDYFKARWGSRVHFSDLEPRTPLRSAMHKGKGKEHAQNALAEMLTLAGCDRLVSCVSNMATVALIANPTTPHRFVQWGWDLNHPIESAG